MPRAKGKSTAIKGVETVDNMNKVKHAKKRSSPLLPAYKNEDEQHFEEEQEKEEQGAVFKPSKRAKRNITPATEKIASEIHMKKTTKKGAKQKHLEDNEVEKSKKNRSGRVKKRGEEEEAEPGPAVNGIKEETMTKGRGGKKVGTLVTPVADYLDEENDEVETMREEVTEEDFVPKEESVKTKKRGGKKAILEQESTEEFEEYSSILEKNTKELVKNKPLKGRKRMEPMSADENAKNEKEKRAPKGKIQRKKVVQPMENDHQLEEINEADNGGVDGAAEDVNVPLKPKKRKLHPKAEDVVTRKAPIGRKRAASPIELEFPKTSSRGVSKAKKATATQVVETDKLTKKPSRRKRAAEPDNISEEPTADNIMDVVEVKKAARRKKAEMDNADEAGDIKDGRKPTTVRKRGTATSAEELTAANGSKPAKTPKMAPLNSVETIYNKSDFDLDPLNKSSDSGEPYTLKVSSWNVAGLRAWLKKDGLKFLEYEEPDIFCLQETKCANDQLPDECRINGFHPYWLCMPGGYAGVAIYSKIMPINVEYGLGDKEFDAHGRIITAEYEKFYLINVYVPNSGRKLVNLEERMRWEKLFQQYAQKLDALKPLVICGDMNVSHKEIDLANPKTNTRSAGFTQEERDKMTELQSLGFVDTFRKLYPERRGAYTYWTYMANARSRNVGWRLDYFLVSERFSNRVVDNCIRSQCKGSDHCPITLFLKV